MALYRTSLRFAHDINWAQRRKWSTTFWVEAANPGAAAAAIAVGWINTLRPAVNSTVFAYEVYATDTDPLTDSFTTVPIPEGSQRGQRTGFTGDQYLNKAAVRVPFTVANSRSSFKFWRPGLYEVDVVDGVAILPALATAISTAFADFRDEMGTALVDPDGQAFTGIGGLRLTTREFGRTAGNDLPLSPPVG